MALYYKNKILSYSVLLPLALLITYFFWIKHNHLGDLIILLDNLFVFKRCNGDF
jgi:hypothetical protein